MKIVITPHSSVDIITNSSTEVFTCQRGHTADQVEEIVLELLRLYHRDAEEAHLNIEVVDEDSQWEKAGDIVIHLDQYSTPWDLVLLLRSIFTVEED